MTGDTIVSSKASGAAAERRALKGAGLKSGSEEGPSSPVLAGVEVPEPVFFCTIEPPSMAKQAGGDPLSSSVMFSVEPAVTVLSVR